MAPWQGWYLLSCLRYLSMTSKTVGEDWSPGTSPVDLRHWSKSNLSGFTLDCITLLSSTIRYSVVEFCELVSLSRCSFHCWSKYLRASISSSLFWIVKAIDSRSETRKSWSDTVMVEEWSWTANCIFYRLIYLFSVWWNFWIKIWFNFEIRNFVIILNCLVLFTILPFLHWFFYFNLVCTISQMVQRCFVKSTVTVRCRAVFIILPFAVSRLSCSDITGKLTVPTWHNGEG